MSVFTQVQLKDQLAFVSNNTQFGEQRVAEVTRLIGTQFDGSTIDPNFWTVTTANSATVTQAGVEAILTSGVDVAGSAKLNTVRRARYISGVSNSYRASIQLGDTGTASNTRKWGVAWGATMPTITDGAYFKLSGTTFSVCTLKGSSETPVNSGSFNGAASTYAITTNAATYEIFYSQSSVAFVINGVLIHTVSAAALPWTDNIGLHCYMDNINSGNTTSVTLKSRFASVRRYGKETSNPQYYHISGNAATYILKYGPGSIHALVFNNTSGTTVTIYDNSAASGNVIAIITTTTSALGAWDYHVPFGIGLCIVTTGNGLDMTVIYE